MIESLGFIIAAVCACALLSHRLMQVGHPLTHILGVSLAMFAAWWLSALWPVSFSLFWVFVVGICIGWLSYQLGIRYRIAGLWAVVALCAWLASGMVISWAVLWLIVPSLFVKLFDHLCASFPKIALAPLTVMAALSLTLLALNMVTAASDIRLMSAEAQLPRLAVKLTRQGQPIAFDSNTAWFHSKSDGAKYAYLVLHGAHADGSDQPTSRLLISVLVAPQSDVLALDHLGFGASEFPQPDAPLDAWNHHRPTRNAYEWLRKRGYEKVLVVGHSMGGYVAIELATRVSPATTFLLGNGLMANQAGGTREDYWFKRFHSDRRMDYRVSLDRWSSIIERYYSVPKSLQRLLRAVTHNQFVMVATEFEWPDVVPLREKLFDALTVPKQWCDLAGATHYLNTASVGRLLFFDAGLAQRLSAGFKAMRDDVANCFD